MTGGKGYYYLGRGTGVGILCLQSVVFGWSLGDSRIREPGVYKLQDGGMWGWGATHHVYLGMMASLDHVHKVAGTVPDPEFSE